MNQFMEREDNAFAITVYGITNTFIMQYALNIVFK